MTIQEMAVLMQDGLVGLAIILIGLVRIPKVDLNLWTILVRLIGKTMNGELIERIDSMDKKLEAHMEKTQEDRMRRARQRILRFCDEILLGRGHSLENFNEVLEDINLYESYCSNHPDFVNNKAVMAIETIKDTYQECIDDHSFLTYEKKQSVD